MSTKKINWHRARDIAEAISKKAFEHLTAPLEQQLEAHAKSLVQATFSEEMLALLFKTKVLDRTENNARVEILPHTYEVPEGHELSLSCAIGFRTNTYHELTLYSTEYYELMLPIQKQYHELTAKRNELYETLKGQVEGKTVKAAVAAWPEAAPIIYKVMAIDEPTPMTQPLEVLLARFLPMLPNYSEGV